MGLGVLDDHKLEHVPGTVHLDVEDAKKQTLDPRLKYDGTTLLVPQPSDDPNDPLNWSFLKRDTILFILSFQSILASCLGTIIAADTFAFVYEWHKTITPIALLTGWYLFGVGIVSFFLIPTARVWGKRHQYVLGSLLLIASTIWGGRAQSYNSFLGSRILQGIATCPFEALLNASVGDMYCVHQRGVRMAFANLSLFGGAFATPIVVGILATNIGWRWSFYMVAIFSSAMTPLVFFFCPETAFRRDDRFNLDLTSKENLVKQIESDTDSPPMTSIPDTNGVDTMTGEPKNGYTHDHERNLSTKKKDTFLQSLRLFNGRKTDDNVFKLILRPFPLIFLQPAIIWGMLTQGALIGWTVMIGVILAAVFIGPPHYFSTAKTGYLYGGPFAGAILGFFLAGAVAHITPRVMAKRNNGVYEPEFRLILVIPQIALAGVGLFGFGAATKWEGWFWPAFFFACEVAAMTIGAVVSALYLVDAHRDIAVEAFTCLLIFKNFFSYALTYKAYDWVNEIGPRDLMYVAGGCQMFVCLLAIPMYVFGKKNRSLQHRHNVLSWFGLA